MSARTRWVHQDHCPRTLVGCFLIIFACISLEWVAFAHSNTESPTTARISLSSSGTQGNGENTAPSISADGRYVAFVSWSSNLVANDTNGFGDVFVRDCVAGTTTRVSLASNGDQAAGESSGPAISADGRYVAFTSNAWNLVSGDTNEVSDVFVRDLTSGSTVRVSLGADGQQANGASSAPCLSANGRFVAFLSEASNLTSGDSNGAADVFIRDLQLGTIVRVSTGSAGEEANADSEHPSISADGHYVAFASAARNLVSSDANSAWDIFLKDVTNGTLVRVSVSSSGAEANGHSFNPVLSGDGQVIAFESEASNLVASDTNSRADVFIHDRGSNTTSRISYGLGTAQANAASTDPSISADGRFIAFVSSASNIVSDDTNGVADVFINDRLGGLTTRASIGNLNAQGQGPALWPALSGDGRYVAFPSGATQFCSGDTNNKVDMFVRGPLF